MEFLFERARKQTAWLNVPSFWMIGTALEAATVRMYLEALALETVTVLGLASAFAFSVIFISPAEYLGAARQMHSEA